MRHHQGVYVLLCQQVSTRPLLQLCVSNRIQLVCRRVGVDLLRHTLDLDLRFHLHRKTGEVTRILDRGGNALQNILSTVLFNIGASSACMPPNCKLQPGHCACSCPAPVACCSYVYSTPFMLSSGT